MRQDNDVATLPPNAVDATDVTSFTVGATGGYGSIAPGPDGRLWYGRDETVGAISTTGTADSYPTSSTNAISGVIVGPDGKLWFGAWNKIIRMTTAGVVGAGNEFPLPAGFSGINDLVLGPDGNVWFTLSGSPASVGKITPSGTITTFATPSIGSLPFGIAAGPDGRIWFAERNVSGVGAIPTDATSGSDIVEYTIDASGNGPIDIVAGPDDRMWLTIYNFNQLLAVETGQTPPPPGPGSTDPVPDEQPPPEQPPPVTPVGPGPAIVPLPSLPALPPPVGCTPNKLILTDVFPQGGKTRLLGVAPAAAAGKSVTLRSAWNGRSVAKATVAPDLSFAATVPLPPRSLRASNRTRYVAVLGSARSQPLKFARRMYATTITASARTIRFSGTVTKPLAKTPQPVVLRASTSCSGIAAGAIVATTTPSRSGAFTATGELPPALASAPAVFLRAQTRVPKTQRNPKLFQTFTLIRGIRTTADSPASRLRHLRRDAARRAVARRVARHHGQGHRLTLAQRRASVRLDLVDHDVARRRCCGHDGESKGGNHGPLCGVHLGTPLCRPGITRDRWWRG